LSSCAQDIFKDLNYKFKTVIIDEACQAVESSSLIPLRYGCERCILFGDPNQLPPTVISSAAQTHGYDTSLFVRILKNNQESMYFLNTQYRMHPEIAKFPSRKFYGSKLKTCTSSLVKPWHSKYPPYCFYNLMSNETQSENSIYNIMEMNAVLKIYESLCFDFPEENV
jgi:senataxin